MSNTKDPNKPQIVYSATSKRETEGDRFIKQHVFDYIISGTSKVYFGGKTQDYNAGDVRFTARNRLSKFVKTPVFIDVGFKDYSHFSFAFKKMFGFAPSLV